MNNTEQLYNMNIPRYGFIRVLLLWIISALPMYLAAWHIIPHYDVLTKTSLYWLASSISGLFLASLSLLLILMEQGGFSLSVLKKRLRLDARSTGSKGVIHAGTAIKLIPVYLIFSAVLVASGVAVITFPGVWLAWPSYSNPFELSSIEHSGSFVWGFLVFCAWLINAFGEELFFRGTLLPAMDKSRAGWLRNAFWYSIYHLHKPWEIPFRFIEGVLLAWPASRYKSLWVSLSVRAIEGAGILIMIIVGVSSSVFHPLSAKLPALFIENSPVYEPETMETVDAIPFYDSDHIPRWSPDKKRDVQNRDLSGLDLRPASKILSGLSFDSRTRWPEPSMLPEGFSPLQIMDLGKNPGLGVRQLHKNGITGRGVSIGIVDNDLLTGHEEYSERLKWYEEIASSGIKYSSMHGSAVASIALGRSIGVAPEADLYFITDRERKYDEAAGMLANRAAAIRRLIQISDRLPLNRKIRVISMSIGWNSCMAGYYDIQKAVREAQDKGIMVISTSMSEFSRFGVRGLYRDALADPDRFESYSPGSFWKNSLMEILSENVLWVPMEARTVASYRGDDEYVYHSQGGMSWAVPYVAGAYALACQVEPDITSERFWKLAIKTGRMITIKHNERSISFGPILDMNALVNDLKNRTD